MVVPWLAFLGVLFFVGVWNWLVVAVLWVIVCGANNLFVRAGAREQLLKQFRLAAAGQQAGESRRQASTAGNAKRA
jgi:Sec-independent protein translocase protein TatA